MVVPKMEYLQALSMYCVSSMIINWRSQQSTRLSSSSATDTFMLARRSFRLATHLFDDGADGDRFGMNGDVAGVEARGGEQARGQLAEQAGLFVDEGHQFRLRGREPAHFRQAGCRRRGWR